MFNYLCFFMPLVRWLQHVSRTLQCRQRSVVLVAHILSLMIVWRYHRQIFVVSKWRCSDGNSDSVLSFLTLTVWLVDNRNLQQSVLRWRSSGCVTRRTSLSLKLICWLSASSSACLQHSMNSRMLKLASRMTSHSSSGGHTLHVLETFFWTLIIKI